MSFKDSLIFITSGIKDSLTLLLTPGHLKTVMISGI